MSWTCYYFEVFSKQLNILDIARSMLVVGNATGVLGRRPERAPLTADIRQLLLFTDRKSIAISSAYQDYRLALCPATRKSSRRGAPCRLPRRFECHFPGVSRLDVYALVCNGYSTVCTIRYVPFLCFNGIDSFRLVLCSEINIEFG